MSEESNLDIPSGWLSRTFKKRELTPEEPIQKDTEEDLADFDDAAATVFFAEESSVLDLLLKFVLEVSKMPWQGGCAFAKTVLRCAQVVERHFGELPRRTSVLCCELTFGTTDFKRRISVQKSINRRF